MRVMDKSEWWRREKEGEGEKGRRFILPISKTTLAAYNIFFRTAIAGFGRRREGFRRFQELDLAAYEWQIIKCRGGRKGPGG